MSFAFKTTKKDRDGNRMISVALRDVIRFALAEKKRSNLTQQELARRLGVDKSHVSRMLSGKSNLTLRSLGEILGALGLEPTGIQVRPKGRTEGNHRTTATTRSLAQFDQKDEHLNTDWRTSRTSAGGTKAHLEPHA